MNKFKRRIYFGLAYIANAIIFVAIGNLSPKFETFLKNIDFGKAVSVSNEINNPDSPSNTGDNSENSNMTDFKKIDIKSIAIESNEAAEKFIGFNPREYIAAKEYDGGAVCDFIYSEIYRAQENMIFKVMDNQKGATHKIDYNIFVGREGLADIYNEKIVFKRENFGIHLTYLHREMPKNYEAEVSSHPYFAKRVDLLKKLGIEDNFGSGVTVPCEVFILNLKFNKTQLVSFDITLDNETDYN